MRDCKKLVFLFSDFCNSRHLTSFIFASNSVILDILVYAFNQTIRLPILLLSITDIHALSVCLLSGLQVSLFCIYGIPHFLQMSILYHSPCLCNSRISLILSQFHISAMLFSCTFPTTRGSPMFQQQILQSPFQAIAILCHSC